MIWPRVKITVNSKENKEKKKKAPRFKVSPFFSGANVIHIHTYSLTCTYIHIHTHKYLQTTDISVSIYIYTHTNTRNLESL